MVEPVDLEPGGAVHHQPCIADRPFGDAVEDPPGARVGGPRLALERQRTVEALGCHADADEALRREPPVSPKAAGLAGRRMEVLARLAAPGSGSPPPPAHLDHVRARWIDRGHPVETVAAEVHDSAALLEVSGQALEHPRRPVLRMAAGDDGAVAAQEI